MVCILLSTYNGEKYLEEQLQSLIAQEGVDIHILVRDDGSQDRTRHILKEWEDRGLLSWYLGDNVGSTNSFMELMEQAPDAEYYAFCDQDDIWKPAKLATAVRMLEQIQNPIKLYYSNLFVYRDGQILGSLFKRPLTPNRFNALLEYNSYGCTFVMSCQLKDKIVKNSQRGVINHDNWTFLSACFLGELIYDHIPQILYRQHGGNQVGARNDFKSRVCDVVKGIRHFQQTSIRQKNAKLLLDYYGRLLNPEDIEIIKTVSEYNHSFKDRLKLLFDRRYRMTHNNLILFLRVLLGGL